LKVYKGGAHGLPVTEKNRLNEDLLEFVRGTTVSGGTR